MAEVVYIAVPDLASLLGISRKNAWKACKSGRLHGNPLEVRTIHGRGGRSGIQYHVKISSLPLHLQERLKTLQTSNEAVSKLRFGDDAQFERNWKYDAIRSAVAFPKGSSERKAEIERLHHTTRIDWTGAQRLLTKSTLYKWIEIYEGEGIHGLAQKVRSDRGAKKVTISRAWSDAVPFDDDTKASIAHDLKQYVRGLIKGDGQFKQTLVLTSEKLRDISAAYGFRPNDLATAETVSRPRKTRARYATMVLMT